jgi:hypothetical protein
MHANRADRFTSFEFTSLNEAGPETPRQPPDPIEPDPSPPDPRDPPPFPRYEDVPPTRPIDAPGGSHQGHRA